VTAIDNAVASGSDGSGGVGSGGGGSGGGGDDKGGSGEAKINLTVALDDPGAAGKLVAGPVRVQFTGTTAKAVLVVPLTALLALSEGGYAVEVKNGAHRSLVAVKTGLFAKGLVEVSGAGLAAGEQVVVTS
jgi:multidrug efflux pump subunit AcrA (membrane-fusion protein)